LFINNNPALIAAIARLINFKIIGILLGFILILLAGRVEYIITGASNLKVKGLLTLNLIL
jgi:hypothetical protein